MIQIRRSEERGQTRFDWLDSRHSFSFGDYCNPSHMGFRALRVINEDRIAAGAGFPMHAHRDMEIVTVVLSGALEHRDSLGSGEVIRPGDVQRMSAGTGIRHSEFNPSRTEPTHLLQIWLLPEHEGISPSYEQKHVSTAERSGRLRLIADRFGTNGALTIHADAKIHMGRLPSGYVLQHKVLPYRHVWLQVGSGKLETHHFTLAAGDAIAASEVPLPDFRVVQDTELVLFALA